MKGILKPSTEAKPYLSSVMFIHDLVERRPEILDSQNPENGDSFLHGLIREGTRFDAIAYLLTRGLDIRNADGIECKDLSAIDIHTTNNAGKTPYRLAEELYYESAMHKPKSMATAKRKLILDLIGSAEEKQLTRFLNDLATYKANLFIDKNDLEEPSPHKPSDSLSTSILLSLDNSLRNEISYPYLSESLEEDAAAKGARVSFHEQILYEHEMPHYPSFDQHWKMLDIANNRYKFIEAYNSKNFSAMEKAILDHEIIFKGSDTISELAYEGINHNCLKMAKFLLKQGSAEASYTPQGEAISLKDKLNQAITLNNARRQAKAALQGIRTKEGESTNPNSSPSKKQKTGHAITIY